MILATRETLGGHTNSGLLPRALAELIVAARETLGGHMKAGKTEGTAHRQATPPRRNLP